MADHKLNHEKCGKVMSDGEANEVLESSSSQVRDIYTESSLHAAVSVLAAKTSTDGDIKSLFTVDGCVGCAMVVAARAIASMADEDLNIFHRVYTEQLQMRAAAVIVKKIAEGVEQAQAEQEAKKAPDTLTEEQKRLLNMQVPGESKWQN